MYHAWRATRANASSAKLTTGTTLGPGYGLVGHWTFDGGDLNWRSNTAYDRSGQGNTGTLTNMNLSSAPTIGKLGQALNFTNGPYVYMGTPASLSITGNLTLSAWIKPNSFGGASRGRIFDNLGVGNGGYVLALNNVDVTKGLCGAAGSTSCSYISNVITLGQWQHVVMTLSGTVMTFYVNGVSVGTASDSAPGSPPAHFEIGASPGNPGNAFDGAIDDARIYNRALTAAEVSQLYKLGTVTSKQ